MMKYSLLGIGDFSHGDSNIWNYRFDLLKKYYNTTNKNIVIFCEISVWQGKNIMNNTIWNIHKKKFEHYDGIKIEREIQKDNTKQIWGKLWQYCSHTYQSKMFVNIIKFIRKHKQRIKIIGVDNDKLDRDYDMFKIIIKHLDENNINFFWSHNSHVDDRKDEVNKQTCGHYLKQKLKNKYCIICSQAYQGKIRFNGFCFGNRCNKRMWTDYFYGKFEYGKYKKIKDGLHKSFNSKLLEFGNSFWIERDDECNGGYFVKSKFDYVLFFHKCISLPK